jgi:hypothetical protein
VHLVFESLGELERRIVALKWRAKEAKVEYTPGGMLDLPRIHPPLVCILLEEPVLRKNKRMGVSVARKLRSILKTLGLASIPRVWADGRVLYYEMMAGDTIKMHEIL